MGTNPTVLLSIDDRHRIATGVDKFHKAGYYGERIKAASGESWSLSYYNPGGLVSDPLSINDPTEHCHAVDTASTFFQVAPKAKLYMLYSSQGYYNGDGVQYKSKFMDESTKVIEDIGITNMFVSLNVTMSHKTYFKDLAAWMNKNPGFKYFWSAGNDSSDRYSRIMEIDEVTGVGAYVVPVSGTIFPAGYSSYSEYLDFAAPSMIFTNIKATKPTDQGYPHSGTSFSAPWLCGMSCLVDDFFMDKKGAPLTNAGMTQFFRDHCVDMLTPGFDTKTGWGAVVLPDPADIDIEKYFNIGRDNKVPAFGGGNHMMLDKFEDKDKVSDWAKDSVEWALNQDIIKGTSDTTMSPEAPVSREMMCVFLKRLYDKTNYMKFEEI